jgi:hypothetical protein
MIDGLSGFGIGFAGSALGLLVGIGFPEIIKLGRFG